METDLQFMCKNIYFYVRQISDLLHKSKYLTNAKYLCVLELIFQLSKSRGNNFIMVKLLYLNDSDIYNLYQ